MGRDRKPRNKLSRREGRDLFGTGGASLERRLGQPPGAPGAARGGGRGPRRKDSEYNRQLREKQKIKRIYGLREEQFVRLYRMARRSREVSGVALLKLLERRLDNVVYRLGFARTRPQARQFVNHGHVLVDGKRVDIPSYLVEPGQSVTLVQGLQANPDVQELAEYPPVMPSWLERHESTGQVVAEPKREDIEPDLQEQLVVEFYSR